MAHKRVSPDFLKDCTASQVVFNVYHELDRPITGITGYAILIATADLPDEKRREIAQEILDYAECLKSLSDAIGEYLKELRAKS